MLLIDNQAECFQAVVAILNSFARGASVTSRLKRSLLWLTSFITSGKY